MRRRKALAEHPFGTLKCRAGYRHFLVRGLAKVRGEGSLMALCYNFSRVLHILGRDRWLALPVLPLLTVLRLAGSLFKLARAIGRDRCQSLRLTPPASPFPPSIAALSCPPSQRYPSSFDGGFRLRFTDPLLAAPRRVGRGTSGLAVSSSFSRPG